jgi:hypothetical protein
MHASTHGRGPAAQPLVVPMQVTRTGAQVFTLNTRITKEFRAGATKGSFALGAGTNEGYG